MSESWWLKVKRAQKHMVDIERAAKDYASRHPYKLTRVRHADRKRKVAYRVRITEQPDPMIAIMLGDFVHNLRSALDHIVVACVPKKRRKSAGFPIVSDPIWDTDAKGQFVVKDDDARERFATAVEGLPKGALAIVERAQPYHSRTGSHRNAIGILSRLENADKHRKLITIGGGVKNLVGTISIRGNVPPVDLVYMSGRAFAKDDTEVGWEIPNRPAPDGTIIQPSEVEMHFIGTAVIHIKITRTKGNESPSDFSLRQTMLAAIRDVRRIVRLIEPFTIP